jgi:predicted nucleotidyltransferase component of viral defense system
MEQKTLLDLQAFLKESANTLHDLHRRRKDCRLKPGESKASNFEIWKTSYEHRHHFIAYCEMRGRTRDQIEKPRENNLPYESKIAKIKEQYGKALRVDETGSPDSILGGASGARSSSVAAE